MLDTSLSAHEHVFLSKNIPDAPSAHPPPAVKTGSMCICADKQLIINPISTARNHLLCLFLLPDPPVLLSCAPAIDTQQL